MKRCFFGAVVFLLLACHFTAFSQNTSNIGTEFWTAYMDHINGVTGPDASQMELYITSNINTQGTVTIADGSFTKDFTVSAKGITVVDIPSSAFLHGSGVFKRGIHIVSQKPIAIYAHIFARAVSGATLLLPVSAMGKDYLSINYTQISNSTQKGGPESYSTFMVIGVEDNTKVEITPSNFLNDGHGARVPFTITLNKGEVYQGESLIDLTGTHVRTLADASGSCKKVAFFSGSSKIAIGCVDTSSTSDNLFQQVYPTVAWGKNYITVPLKSRPYDIFRVVASQPDTHIVINGQSITIDNIKGYYEFKATDPQIITADKPVQVVQYAVTQGIGENCEKLPNDVGDPEMIYLNPIEQTLDHVTLYSTSNYLILKNYINVLIKTAYVNTFSLDGMPYNKFTVLPGNTLYSYAQIPVVSGPHSIQASDGFNAIAYGFGNAESYGYSAGANLQNLDEYIALDNVQTNTQQKNGCSHINYRLQLTLPFQTNDIKWTFSDNTPSFDDKAPVPVSSFTRNGKTLYVYQYPNIINHSAGDYSVIATVFNPVADACGSTDNIEFDFNISDPPVPDFSAIGLCATDSTLFTDKSDAKGNFIKTWLWDFGDGSTSDMQNPAHLYSKGGTYKVTLSVVNENDCASASKTANVVIIPKPQAAFDISMPPCAHQNVTFTDHSTAAVANINTWIWSFGDGSKPDTVHNNNPLTHLYDTAGTYKIKLLVVLETGCVSDTAIRTIDIAPAPLVDFDVPGICLSDAYAQFTNKSALPDGSTTGLTYHWDFGDPYATPGNPNTSTDINPRHKYTQARFSDNPYHVTLTVTSSAGCSYTKTQDVTVNDKSPVTAFTVENKDDLCAGSPVVFDDNTTISRGAITKVVWFFDTGDKPADSVVYLAGAMPASHKYNFQYDAFSASQSKTVHVEFRAYSGVTCFDVSSQDIALHAVPQVTLTAPAEMCANDAPVKIAEDRNGFSGTAQFSGNGVSADGTFDPQVAGVGTAVIQYSFTTPYGCSFTTTKQIVVNAVPVITMPAQLTVLQGGHYTIKASATGDSLKYSWSPATGLNRADVLTPVISPDDDISYTLTAITVKGCTVSATVFVKVLKYLQIPNAFTPNGDGINDTWNIKYIDSYPNNTVDIYNRYGEKVYSSVGYAIPWDGRLKGVYLPSGTYYYIINPKNGRDIISGSVTIIR